MEVKEALINEIGETLDYISNCVPGSEEEEIALKKLESLYKILNEANKNESNAILEEMRIEEESKWKELELDNTKKNQRIDMILKIAELGIGIGFFAAELIFSKNENRLTRIFEESGTIRDRCWNGTKKVSFGKKKS